MALVTVLSFAIVDGSGGSRKSHTLFLPDTLTLAQAGTFVTDYAAALDACIDGAIVEASVTFPLTLPGGIKTDPVAQSDVERGALLSYGAADTAYRYSTFVPTWKDAGFSADDVVATGVYGTLETAILSGPNGGADVDPTDKYGNDLDSYLGGTKRFRK